MAAMTRSVVELRNVLANRLLKLGVVGSVDLVFLLAFEEENEARLAGERAALKSIENFLWDVVLNGAEELHAREVLIEANEERSVVLLHGIATAAPRKVQVNACKSPKAAS